MRTVIWKEWRSLWSGGVSAAGTSSAMPFGILPAMAARYVSATRLRLLLMPLLLGVIAGSESGSHLNFVVTFMIVYAGATIGAESFAGERERGTLQTLLASPLSDAAIAGGKLLAGWLYALMLTVAFLVVTVSVRLGRLGASAFSPHGAAQAGGFMVMLLLLAFAIIGVAVVVSTWAQTTRSALQGTFFVFVAVAMLVVFAEKLHFMPNIKTYLANVVQHGWSVQSAAVVGGSVIALDIAVYAVARLRCTRRALLAHA